MDISMTDVNTQKTPSSNIPNPKVVSVKVAGVKERDAAKTSRIPIKIIPQPMQRKPEWIRMKVPDSARYQEIKKILRDNNLHTVCEEASCPNIGECFSGGTATFMILGDICTRRCPFCDVAHGKPLPPDTDEARAIQGSIAEARSKAGLSLVAPAVASGKVISGSIEISADMKERSFNGPLESLL